MMLKSFGQKKWGAGLVWLRLDTDSVFFSFLSTVDSWAWLYDINPDCRISVSALPRCSSHARTEPWETKTRTEGLGVQSEMELLGQSCRLLREGCSLWGCSEPLYRIQVFKRLWLRGGKCFMYAGDTLVDIFITSVFVAWLWSQLHIYVFCLRRRTEISVGVSVEARMAQPWSARFHTLPMP